MVVYPVFHLQFAKFLRRQLFLLQNAVDAFCGKGFQLPQKHVIGFLAFIGYHQPDSLYVQPVNDGFYGDITGKAPKRRVTLSGMEGVAEQAVKEHVQVCAVYKHAVGKITLYQVARVIEYFHPVRTDMKRGKVHFIAQRAQCNIEEAHGKVELTARRAQYARSNFYQLFVRFVHALSSCSIAVPASLSEPISAELIILHLSGDGNAHHLLPDSFNGCFRK